MSTQQIFLTADHHFGHKAIVRYSERPFATIDEMDAALISRWNEVVGPKDIVFHIGDISFHRAARTEEILHALNGRIRLVRGNHDKNLSAHTAKRFEWVKDYYEYRWAKSQPEMILCHYAFDVWNKGHYGAFHVHGHSHGNLKTVRPRRMDVGVDTNDLYPYNIHDVVACLEKESFKAVDHHTENRYQ